MKTLRKLLSMLIALSLLCSCSVSTVKDDIEPPSITIETYNTFTTAETTQDTTLTTTAPVATTAPDTPEEVTTTPIASEDLTEAVTTPVSESEVISSSDELSIDDYEIADYEGMMYANANLNIRALPDADSDRVGRFKEGDEVEITGLVSNGWYRVKYDGGEYFVNGRYLSDTYEFEVTTEATAVTTTTPTTAVTPPATTTTTTATEPELEYEIEDDEPNIVIGSNSYNPLNYDTQKAMWLAYLDIDSMLLNATESEFRVSVKEAMNNVTLLGCNTVYVHVRAFGDAYYHSNYYAFTAAYSGTMGVKPSYDPLEIMIDEAHKSGLSFHAWINPMRTTTKKRYKEMSDSYTLKKWYNSDSTNGTYLVYDSGTEYYWLSPAYPAVRELICNGIAELVSNYDVDAIHIDDYFYPTTSSSFDKEAFKASGASDLTAWRQSVVSQLVREMYATVKACNSSVLFGISPAGNISNNTDKYYADVITWCSNKGYMDYVVPQIYYNYGDKLPFETTIIDWADLVTEDSIDLVCGIAAYKVGTTSSWSTGGILKRQTDDVNSLSEYSGVAYYRYGTVFLADSDIAELMDEEISKLIISIATFS
ncbi:MAG: family 10 glycosylhydrolase [Oscillospiraceae bacterium]|nr:family 10 glycosylhydrolase [Oscillospiraceae bacterium]